jgi:hypothetical protein
VELLAMTLGGRAISTENYSAEYKTGQGASLREQPIADSR